MKYFANLLIAFCFFGCAKTTDHVFKVVILGAGGGLNESNLSCYLISPIAENRFVALDAGTILAGIQKAERANSFADITAAEKGNLSLSAWLMKHGIKAYLISHAHFDHTSGMIINSPDDGSKTIIGLQNTIDDLRDHVFNGRSWINFSNEGNRPLNKYQLVRVTPRESLPIVDTSFKVTAFPLSHSNRGSTAFLLESNGQYVLYFGDTGPDAIEKSTSMLEVWKFVGPLIRQNKVRGIFLEISYPDGRPDGQLNSHLTPAWFMREAHSLAQVVNENDVSHALSSAPFIVTHIKPSYDATVNPRELIESQLKAQNDLNLKILFAEQGTRIDL